MRSAILSFGYLFALGVVMGMATPLPLYFMMWSSTGLDDLLPYWERDALSASIASLLVALEVFDLYCLCTLGCPIFNYGS